MFAVPKNPKSAPIPKRSPPPPPPPPLLYSKDFISDVKGYIRCLEKLMSHPRAKLPDNHFLLSSLMCYYTSIVNFPYVPSSRVNTILLKQGLKRCAHYENIVARAVPGGKTVAEALAEISEEHNRNNQ
ncbi:unnamed protein product [Caenorhabditis nigoni]